MNENILNDKAFLSVYILSMFFLPIFFIFSLASFNLPKFMVELITVVVFLALTGILLFLCMTKIKDTVNMSNYLSIIFSTMFIVPIFTLSYYSSVSSSEDKNPGENMSTVFKLLGNLMTSALIIVVVFVNLISSNAINYLDVIPGPHNKNITTILILVSSIIGALGLGFLFKNGFSYFKQKLNDVQIERPTTSSNFKMVFDVLKKILSDLIGPFNGYISNIGKDISNSPDKQSTLLKYVGLYGFIFMIGVILYMAAFDPEAITNKAYVYTLSTIIPLIILIGFVIPFSKTQRSATSTALLIGVISLLLLGGFYSYSSLNSTSFKYVSYIINFILFLIVIAGLAIFFYVFSNYLKSIEGFAGFFIYFIFYIPCLLIDFFNYLLNELNMTSRPIYALFVFEILLILLYIYAPMLINYIINKTNDSIVLLKDSSFLNKRHVIGNSSQLRMTTPEVPGNTIFDNKQYVYRKSYSLSMWTFLNIQPPNNASYSSETNILDYGNGKPRITYYNNMDSDKTQNKYIFYFTDSTNGPSSYSLTLPTQKWNYIVFNYYSNKVDLFINGNLERTFTFNNNMPNYLAIDNIIIGSDNGLDGAICNVNYFTAPLSKTKISNTFNLLKSKNPPTFSK